MAQEQIGILHPGNMGVSVAASTKAAGHRVVWASEGRSEATRRRAAEAELEDLGTMPALCGQCEVLLSVCPPHAAEAVAAQAIAAGFQGRYLDANAISPMKSQRIAERSAAAGVDYVDGGIIGGPAWTPGNTWLYLSGPSAPELAETLRGGPLEIAVVGMLPGNASALKMCYAAYTKGSTALLAAILAVSERLGVRSDLEKQWEHEGSGLAERAANRTQRVTAKAWRFEGEMHEIAATFESAGLPSGFHEAAAEVYRRMRGLEEHDKLPLLEDVLGRLLKD